MKLDPHQDKVVTEDKSTNQSPKVFSQMYIGLLQANNLKNYPSMIHNYPISESVNGFGQFYYNLNKFVVEVVNTLCKWTQNQSDEL